MRRIALALVVVLLTSAPAPAGAAPEDWAGSRVTTPDQTGDDTPTVTAELVRSYADTNPATRRVVASTSVAAPAGLPPGCASSVGATSITRVGTVHHTSAELTTTCNGRYSITVTGTLQRRSCTVLGCGSWSTLDTHQVSGSVFVAASPSPVTGTTAAPADGRSVLVSWIPPSEAQPDLGYRVERVSASGATVTLADIADPTTTTYTDAAPPPEGGVTTYRVYATRPGPGGSVSSSPSVATAEVERDPDYEPPADPPGGPGPTTPGGGGGGGGGGDDAGGGPSRRSGGGAVRSTSPGVPAVRVPRVGSPSRSFFPPLLSPPVDAGYDEDLPYGEGGREPGAAEAELPNDLAAGLADAAPGRGLAIPMATGLLLAVWAFHLRFLARAGRPQVDGDDAPELVTWSG